MTADRGAHQPRGPALPAASTVTAQDLLNARRPVGTVRFLVDTGGPRGQDSVSGGPRGKDAGAALVVGGTGDLKQAAHTGNAVACGFSASMKGSRGRGLAWRLLLHVLFAVCP